MRKLMVIPDLQVKKGVPLDHLTWIARYAIDKKPDGIFQMGDWFDMPSLSKYDKGKRQAEGQRYKLDIDAGNESLEVFEEPFREYNNQRKKNKEKQYKPRREYFRGNHEFRVQRAIDDEAVLEGTYKYEDMKFAEYGWNVNDFLEIVEVDGISFSHYFANSKTGKPIGGTNIETRIKNIGFSFFAGHEQTLLTGMRELNNGRRLRGIVAGACYLHEEKYRGPQGTCDWRGVLMLHEVHNGDFSLMEVSLDFLCRKYENMSLPRFMKNKYPDIFNESQWLKRHELKEAA